MTSRSPARWKGAVALLMLACVCTPSAGGVGSMDAFDRFRGALGRYFGGLGYFPVTIDRGIEVGAVMEVDGVGLRSRAAKCFHSLVPPKPIRELLPEGVLVDGAGTSFRLRLLQLLGIGGGGQFSEAIELRFTEVSIIAVTRPELSDALDASACPDVAPMIDGGATKQAVEALPLGVISEVLYGKREAVLHLVSAANLEAKVKEISRIAGSADLSAEVSSGGLVRVKSDVVLPLAFRTITLATTVTQGPAVHRGDAAPAGTTWEAFTCEPGSGCSDPFKKALEVLDAARLVVTPEELER
jgi:hypothetical protein